MYLFFKELKKLGGDFGIGYLLGIVDKNKVVMKVVNNLVVSVLGIEL